MDRIKLAERQYQELIAKFGAGNPPIGRTVNAWIETYVLPAVEELWTRPQFQELAAWPARHFGPGAASPERQHLLTVADALVAEAMALLHIASVPMVQQQLDVSCPPLKSSLLQDDPLAKVQMLHSQVLQIAGRPWKDLVFLEDYFGPVAGLLGNLPAAAVPTGSGIKRSSSVPRKAHGNIRGAQQVSPARVEVDLHPFFNPTLTPLGDYVSRCMDARVRVLVEILREFRHWVWGFVARQSDSSSVDERSESAAWNELQKAYGVLRHCCMDSRALAQREAAISLAQAYLALRPDADTGWLGLPQSVVANETLWTRVQLTKRFDLRTLDHLAAALGEMSNFYQNQPSQRIEIEKAIGTKALVIIKEPRQMYWEGKQIGIEWKRHSGTWQFWLKLAERSKRGGSIGVEEMFNNELSDNETRSRSALYSCKSRADSLMTDHAPSLARKLGKGSQPGAYQLDLDPSQIHIFPQGYSD